MYKFNELRRLEIEPTNICQARCPQCTRTPADGTVNKSLNDQLGLSLLQTQIPKSFWQALASINFNGTTGDCMAHHDITDIVAYIKQNSTAPLTIHTNGGLGSTSKWQQLANILDQSDRVVFGLDGLADTHHLYRIGVDFDLVIRNAKTFIAHGGNAVWQFIPFQHNQHQIATAQQMSKELGFASFLLRRSGRFDSTNAQQVFVDAKFSHTIKQFEGKLNQLVYTEPERRQHINTHQINCESINTKWIGIYADGTVWPCCHLMGQHRVSHFGISQLVNKKLLDVVGDYSQIDLHHHTLEAIINSDIFQQKYVASFTSQQPIPICVSECRNNVQYKNVNS